MKKIYILFLFISAFFIQSVSAQCPTPIGMVGVPITLNGNCFINIQFAIPNSNVSIYNTAGYVAQGTASATGSVVIPYACGNNPITSILSISPSGQICSMSNITQIIILPIKLVSFSATLGSNKIVKLKWETSYEFNNEKFELERSTDGINYDLIATLNSAGNGIQKQEYFYDDITFQAGKTAYYRLKQTDFDGTVSYSKIVYVSDLSATDADYTVFPNPVSSSNNVIQIKGIAAGEVTYKNIFIFDLAGRTVRYTIVGANAIALDPATNAGIYILRIKDKTLKLIKN